MCQVPAGRVDEGERTGEKTWNFKYHVNMSSVNWSVIVNRKVDAVILF